MNAGRVITSTVSSCQPSRGGRNDQKKVAALLAPLAALVATAVIVAGSASAAGKPIVIGWAYDAKGAMAAYDNPALAAAQLRVKQVNARGGVKRSPAADHHL